MSEMCATETGKVIAKARLDKLANAAPVEILGMGYRQALREVKELIEEETFEYYDGHAQLRRTVCDTYTLKAKLEAMIDA